LQLISLYFISRHAYAEAPKKPAAGEKFEGVLGEEIYDFFNRVFKTTEEIKSFVQPCFGLEVGVAGGFVVDAAFEEGFG
jgi:hypothetical protein